MNKTKGRLQFLALLAAFLLPIAIVGGMYWMNWNPGGAGYGTLIKPPRELALEAMPTHDGKPFKPEDWRDKWHLVYISAGTCSGQCEKDLYEMRQIHASLAKEIERLQRVWLVKGEMSATDLQTMQQKYPDLVILPAADTLAQQFTAAGQADDRFYLVDPLGKLMMRYPKDAEAKGIRNDVLKLLRYSWAG